MADRVGGMNLWLNGTHASVPAIERACQEPDPSRRTIDPTATVILAAGLTSSLIAGRARILNSAYGLTPQASKSNVVSGADPGDEKATR
jgi:hypothetical protein